MDLLLWIHKKGRMLKAIFTFRRIYDIFRRIYTKDRYITILWGMLIEDTDLFIVSFFVFQLLTTARMQHVSTMEHALTAITATRVIVRKDGTEPTAA